jgi:hypothetical protein
MVDQAEELFTRKPSMDRHRFAQLLCQAVAGPVRVIAAMRSEFLDDLWDLSALASAPIEAYMLAPLDQEALRMSLSSPPRWPGCAWMRGSPLGWSARARVLHHQDRDRRLFLRSTLTLAAG